MATASHGATANLTGYIADLPTPFDDDGRIDLMSLEKLCERQIAAGTSAVVVGETAGEASTLTIEEHDAVVRATVKTARGRVLVIAGAGSNSTSQAVELTKRAEAEGADAILSVAPYYNKPMQSGIVAHFHAVASATRLPVILHDIPSRTGRALSDNTIVQLAQSGQIIGISDATGDVTRPMRLRSLIPGHFQLLSGDDATAMAYLAAGGDGCISIVCNVVPELCQRLFFSLELGELETARAIAARLTQLTRCLSQDSTAASLKYALSLLGLMLPLVRLPIVALDDACKTDIDSAIASIFGEEFACSVAHVTDFTSLRIGKSKTLHQSSPRQR